MSTSVHVIVFSALGLIPAPSQVLAMHESEFEVIEPPPPPAPPPEVKPPEPEPPPPEPVKAARRAAPQPVAAEPPPPEAAKPAAEEVADFTGVTLTAADGSGSWSTQVGSGSALRGPVGKIGTRPPTHGDQNAAKTAAPGPRVVPVGSLARKVAPPNGLDVLLERNYPRRARLQGVEGKVVVSLRILPTGRIGDIRIVQEFPSGFEFASACRETLRQAPPFSPPLDRAGAAVATDVTFTCSFEVAY